jgi:melanoma-associated antigen p97
MFFPKQSGPSYIRAMENQTMQCDQSRPSIMRWCVTSKAENAKCIQMQYALDASFVKPNLQCVQAKNAEECAALIIKNQADLVTLDAGELFKAGWAMPLVPIMHEEYGKKTASSWSVAVVKKSDQRINWNNLRGRNACFSGVGHAAGWVLPIYQLWSTGHLQPGNQCDLITDVSRLFAKSCAPGANAHQALPLTQNLCQLCNGSADNF